MTRKQQQFCYEYLKDFNGARAYKEVYKNCSEDIARKSASRILKTKEDVRTFIEKETERINNEKICDIKEIRELLSEIARGETTKGSTMVIEAIGGGLTQAREVNKKPEDKDRLKALELLGKANNMFTDKVDLNANMDINVEIEDNED